MYQTDFHHTYRYVAIWTGQGKGDEAHLPTSLLFFTPPTTIRFTIIY